MDTGGGAAWGGWACGWACGLGRGGPVGGDHRQTHGHRLHVRPPPPLAAAGQHKGVGGGVESRQRAQGELLVEDAHPPQRRSRETPLGRKACRHVQRCADMCGGVHRDAAVQMCGRVCGVCGVCGELLTPHELAKVAVRVEGS
eukprot:scaffold44631_cov66-Phaeocystis_antarctica.AAC.6